MNTRMINYTDFDTDSQTLLDWSFRRGCLSKLVYYSGIAPQLRVDAIEYGNDTFTEAVSEPCKGSTIMLSAIEGLEITEEI